MRRSGSLSRLMRGCLAPGLFCILPLTGHAQSAESWEYGPAPGQWSGGSGVYGGDPITVHVKNLRDISIRFCGYVNGCPPSRSTSDINIGEIACSGCIPPGGTGTFTSPVSFCVPEYLICAFVCSPSRSALAEASEGSTTSNYSCASVSSIPTVPAWGIPMLLVLLAGAGWVSLKNTPTF